MTGPRVEVLGVYKLAVTDELLREQLDLLYGNPMSKEKRAQAERQCREQLSSVVLVEALIHNRDGSFDAGQFTQPQDGVPRSAWQVAWGEAYLTLGGGRLMVERWSAPPDSGDLRVAFYMHFWDPGKPLRTGYGDVACPPLQEMPERLQRLVPYEPVD